MAAAPSAARSILIDKKIPTRILKMAAKAWPSSAHSARGTMKGGRRRPDRRRTVPIRVQGRRAPSPYDDYGVPGFDKATLDGSFNRTPRPRRWACHGSARAAIWAPLYRTAQRIRPASHTHEYESCHPHGSSLHCGGRPRQRRSRPLIMEKATMTTITTMSRQSA